jgi:hypothetical protein
VERPLRCSAIASGLIQAAHLGKELSTNRLLRGQFGPTLGPHEQHPARQRARRRTQHITIEVMLIRQNAYVLRVKESRRCD